MSKDEGIYLSVDYRVTDTRTGALLDDASVKHLTVHYPPLEGGPKALLAYTGIARLPDGTPMGDWMRETLRGESEVFDVSMKHLRERLDRDLAGLGHPLIVNALVVHEGRRYFGGVSNVRANPGGGPTLNPTFGYLMNELTEPMVIGNGSGAARVLADRHLEKLMRRSRCVRVA
jgi:hypothetical protein